MRKLVTLLMIINLAACSREPASYYEQQTGLYWMQCPVGQVYYEYQCQGVAKTMHWDEALRYCAGLGGLWRLASREQLIAYYTSFGALKMNIGNLYWTSSTQSGHPELAWYLIPKLNILVANLKELDGLVLCVTS